VHSALTREEQQKTPAQFSVRKKTYSYGMHQSRTGRAEPEQRQVKAPAEEPAAEVEQQEGVEQQEAAQLGRVVQDLGEPVRAMRVVLVRAGQELAKPADEKRPAPNVMHASNNQSQKSARVSSAARSGTYGTTVQLSLKAIGDTDTRCSRFVQRSTVNLCSETPLS
jgi:hypothetical protein